MNTKEFCHELSVVACALEIERYVPAGANVIPVSQDRIRSTMKVADAVATVLYETVDKAILDDSISPERRAWLSSLIHTVDQAIMALSKPEPPEEKGR